MGGIGPSNTFGTHTLTAKRGVQKPPSKNPLFLAPEVTPGSFGAGGKQECGRELCADLLWLFARAQFFRSFPKFKEEHPMNRRKKIPLKRHNSRHPINIRNLNYGFLPCIVSFSSWNYLLFFWLSVMMVPFSQARAQLNYGCDCVVVFGAVH